jgi:acyl carrier protein
VEELRNSLKVLICEALNLQDVSPPEIDDEAPLFGGGLGLDSVDALELAIEIEQRHGIRLGQSERAAFASVSTLAHFIKNKLAERVP